MGRRYVREEKHSIRVGTLVEIMPPKDMPRYKGVRAFVVWRGWDCDKTPLYFLSMDRYDTTQKHSTCRNESWIGGFSINTIRKVTR